MKETIGIVGAGPAKKVALEYLQNKEIGDVFGIEPEPIRITNPYKDLPIPALLYGHGVGKKRGSNFTKPKKRRK